MPTTFFEDATVGLIARNTSPDIGFDASLNPYRGCEHGCAYCYARPTHEYLGYSAGLDFETKIVVKTRAPELLAVELGKRSWRPQVLAMSGVTDPYQPVERTRRITRGCLAVLARYRNPVALITKNALIARDADLLAAMAAWQGASATISVTTLDAELARKLEPRTSSPRQRLEALGVLADAGIPVGVNIAPVIPGLNEGEMPAIIAAAKAAGARWVNYVPLRLPGAVGPLFLDWLDRHFPGRRAKIEQRVRTLRHGQLNDPRFGHRMRGEGLWAEQLRALRDLGLRRAGLIEERPTLSTAAFRRDGGVQGELFGPDGLG